MSNTVLLYTSQLNSRIEYVFRLIFKDLLNFSSITFSTDLSEFREAAAEIKISYGTFFDKSIPFLDRKTDLLFEKELKTALPKIQKTEQYPIAFRSDDSKAILPFDFPAFAFYLVSRYEEYQHFQCDKHGRFPASAGIAYREGFLEQPLIDLWARELYNKLVLHYGAEKLPALPDFTFQPSYDIDYAWAYLHKGVLRSAGAMAKQVLKGDFKGLSNRLKVMSGRKQDPYFNFDYLSTLHEQYPKLTPLYFWLVGNYGKFDKNTSYKNKTFRALIKSISSNAMFGIHPSYQSEASVDVLKEEISRLEEIMDNEVSRSRQHFLKLSFPETYQRLLAAGIRDDYTMGYANTIGFRASIARSFYWYDLSREAETNLRIHPFMFMDVTLKDYMKLKTNEILERLHTVIAVSKTVGAELSCIWHNNSFSEQEGWEGWRAVYEAILKEIGL